MTIKKIYTANLGYSGSSFIAYVMGLHEKIYSVHQPKVNLPELWTPTIESAKNNVGHILGKIWLDNKDEFFSIDKNNLDSISGLEKFLKKREDYVQSVIEKTGKIYHESANSLFPFLNLKKDENTKFIHLARDPYEWIERAITIQNPNDYLDKKVHHRNLHFATGKTNLECAANIWLNINTLIRDIASKNKENWHTITLTDIRENPAIAWPKVFKFLNIEPPDVDFENINNITDKMGSVQPNKTFTKRPVKNSKSQYVKVEYIAYYDRLLKENKSTITEICGPLWQEIQNEGNNRGRKE